MTNTYKIIEAAPNGGKYLRLIYEAMTAQRISGRQLDALTTDTLIEMDKVIKNLEKELIKAKARALPDDFIESDKYSIRFTLTKKG